MSWLCSANLGSSVNRPLRWIAIFSLVCLGVAGRLEAQEFRAAWADVFHVGMGSQTEVNNMVSSLVAGRYNAVIVQVLGYMDNNGNNSHGAHWKSSILPWSPRVTAGFDPLAYLCTQAHANGIQVHAWLGGSGGGPYRVSTVWPPGGNSTLAAHPEWFMVPQTNSEKNAISPVDGNYVLDMGSPDAQEYIISIVRELVTNYQIDGINWDDEINGTGYAQGYAFPAYHQTNYVRSGLARYRINTGYVGTPSPTDSTYGGYRRRFKNELMARCQAEIQSIKTNPRQPLRHTSAPLAYGSAPGTCDFTSSTPYLYYCDWASMLQNGWIDAAIPQVYRAETNNAVNFRGWCDRTYACWRYSRHIYIGLGAYLNTKSNTLTQLQYVYTGQAGGTGLNGSATYSYAVPNTAIDGGDWWSYAAANIFTSTSAVPTMPWRNPATATNGMMWGRVQNGATGLYVDDATVAVSGGPTVKTDGNGYYVATLISATAAGTVHSTVASKSGMTPQTNSGATVLAGDVVRYDFILNQGLAAPSGLTATAVSTSQVNLAWSDNATNETGYVVSRSLTAGGPYTVIATLAANSTGYTNTGLNSSTTYYYVTRATNASTASANSNEASATTQAPPTPPSITGQPQNQTVPTGSTVVMGVTAGGTLPLSYQWRWYGTNLSGATATSLTLNNAAVNQSGPYSVRVTNAYGSTTSQVATLSVTPYFQAGSVTQLWSLAPYSKSYLDTNSLPNVRCLAYNPVSRHLLVASRNGPHVYVLNADTTADLNELNVSAVSGGTYPLLMVGVADDGVVYAGNLTTGGTTIAFKLYRWANDSSATVPTVAYSGDPGSGNNQRWGDTLDVRGAGADTQIIIGSRSGNLVAVLTTADGVNFAAQTVTIGDAPVGAFGLGIAFGVGNSFWGKATSQALRQCSFDLPSASGSSTRVYADPDFPASVAPIGVSTTLNLLGGINVGAANNHFRLYDLTTNNGTPILIATSAFPTDYDNTGTGTGAVDFGGDRVFALCANNGIIALQILPAVTPPAIGTQPQSLTVNAGQNAPFTVSATGTAPLYYQWRFNGTNIDGATDSSYTRFNVQPPHAGPYSVLVSNVAGSITSTDAVLSVILPAPAHIDSITIAPDSRIHLQITAAPGHYSIDGSSNIVDWAELTNLITTNSVFEFIDPEPLGVRRFYRARIIP